MKAGRILLVATVIAALVVALPVSGEAKRKRDRKAPRIKQARMVDSDGNLFADKLMLTYNEKVRHKRDADGRYPFTVEGYAITSVSRARRKKITINLEQGSEPDGLAVPTVKYRRVKNDAVRDRARKQARKQTFSKTRPFTDAAIVTVHRNGEGTVLSLPVPSINCGEQCRAAFPKGSLVTLNATPPEGFEVEWGGDCSGTTGPSCILTLDSDKGIVVSFVAQEGTGTFTLTVLKDGTGDAQIVSVPAGIDCGVTCSAEFSPNAPVALNANSLIGTVTWSGCVDATGLLPCTVIMDSDKTVTATFSGP